MISKFRISFIWACFFIFLLSGSSFALSRLNEMARVLDKIEQASGSQRVENSSDIQEGLLFLYPYWRGTHYDPFNDLTGGRPLGFDFACQLGYAYLDGDTTYKTTTSDGSQSELEFPLAVDLIGGRVDVAYNEPSFSYYSPKFLWSFELYGDVSNSGELKDRDWIAGDGEEGLDVYSVSPVKMNARVADMSLLWNVWVNEGAAFGLVFGYRYHKFEYLAYDTNQEGYGIYALTSTDYYPGATLRYYVKYSMPYVGFSWNTRMGERLYLDGRMLYSPWVNVDDEDDHLLRYKRSKTDADGDAFLMSLHGRYAMFSGWFVDLGLEYGTVDADGIQHQEFYDGPNVGTTYDVHNDITSDYGMAMVSLGKDF